MSNGEGMDYGDHVEEVNEIVEELFDTGEIEDPQDGAEIIIQVMEELDGGYYD